MLNMSDSIILTSFVAVRTVAEVHRMVVQWWVLFQEAVEITGVEDPPQLLPHLRRIMTLTPSQHQHQHQFQLMFSRELQQQQRQVDLHSHL